MSNDSMARTAAETKAWQLGEPNQQVTVWPDEDRRHLVLELGEDLIVRLQAEKADTLLREIAKQSELAPTVQRWVEEIHEERTDSTGAAHLRHQWDRQRREEAAVGTLGKSEVAQALAKEVRITPDDQDPNK